MYYMFQVDFRKSMLSLINETKLPGLGLLYFLSPTRTLYHSFVLSVMKFQW